MSTYSTLILIASHLALASTALAQNDECATAAPLGLGTTPFDTSTATLSLPAWPCGMNGGPDLWYQFTAVNDAVYTFDTCGSGYDTTVQAFSGTCAALTNIACNDDTSTCGLQSSISVSVLPGTTFFVRVGGFSGLFGAGTLNVSETLLPAPSGSVPAWLTAVGAGTPALYTNSLLPGPILADIGAPTGATSVSYEFVVYGSNQGPSSGLLGNLGSGTGASAALKFEQWNDTMQYGVTAFGVADHVFPGGNNTEATDIHLVFVANVGSATTELFVNGVSFGVAPYAPVLQGLQGIGQIYRPNGNHIDLMAAGRIRGIAVYDAALALAEIVAHRDAYFTGSLGTAYCSPAVVNTSGAAAQLRATGSTIAAANSVTLEASSMPANQFGFFLTSQTQGNVMNPGGSQGILCLSGVIGRYVGPGQIKNAGAAGAFQLAIDLNRTPAGSVFLSVLPGQTWNFQAWFRDIGPLGQPWSNFTNGRSLTFQ